MNIRCINVDDAKAFSALRREVTRENPVPMGLTYEEELTRTLESFRAQVYVPNEPALGLYKSIGFVECGVEPEAVYLDGQYYDGVHMTLAKKQA